MSCSGSTSSPFKIADDRLGGLDADLVGMLDRVGVDLAVLDRLLALGLAVEGDDLHLVGLAGLFEGRQRAEGRRIVDRKNAGQVGMGLQGVLRGPVALVLLAVAGQLGDDLDLARRRGRGCAPRSLP